MFRALAGALALVCVSTFSHGKWENVADEWPDLTDAQKQWFSKQRGADVGCCDVADGHHTDWKIKDDHYFVPLKGEWVEVPEGALLKGPNPIGVAIVWYTTAGDAIRCFIPGPGA